MRKKIVIKNKNTNTEIIIKYNHVLNYLKKISKDNNQIYCIVDNKVKYIFNNFKCRKNLNLIYISGGENIKNIKIYEKICEKLLSKKIDRNSILIAIGGGSIGDLCGFVASTILRGVTFKLIPTTLLSQVDSSIGGKNGINSRYGKNLIGSFLQPNEVIIDPIFLKTLPYREIKSGYAEIVKYALIKDFAFFKWLEKNFYKLLKLDDKILEKAILKSIEIKLFYVKKDPKENLINHNSRAMLNFGHTIGHSLETLYKYHNKLNHGEAVSIGMITEAIISNKLKYLSDNHLNLIINHFNKSDLKIFDKNISNKKIIYNIMKDKKNSNGKVNIVLLRGIGKSFFARKIIIDDLIKILKKI